MSDERDEAVEVKGPLAWMAANSVAANLLMIMLLVGGLISSQFIKQEVFPEVSLDVITVQVPYPGASPAEVEKGVILAVEEAVRGVDGIEEVKSTASESIGTVSVEVSDSAEPETVLNDVKSAVDRITSLPQDSERPVISLSATRRGVISLVLHGDVEEKVLRNLAESVREDLLLRDDITVVEIGGARDPEISIEVSQDELRQYGLSLEQIARIVSSASIELPGGSVKTDSGEILLRTTERRDEGSGFANIIVLSRPDGTQVRLGEIAEVIDGFEDSDIEARFDGNRAMRVDVFRVGDQTPIEIADAVKAYIEDDLRPQLPEGIGVSVWNDQSEIYQDRINLLLKNARIGLLLVLLALGLFLELRLAFWVTMGITISVVGSLIAMPIIDVSLNMISLFAFILILGIVVDDAIVIGEAVYSHRMEGKGGLQAAIDGAREVGGPVVFSVLTTVIAFTPLFFVPGIMGKFFINVPMIVVPILILSLIESLFILPAHLAHKKDPAKTGVLGWVNRQQQRFSGGLETFVEKVYQPFVRLVVKFRYITLATGVALLLITVGGVGGGFVRFIFFPKIEGDLVTVGVQMPYGSPVSDTKRVAKMIEREGNELMEELGGRDALVRGMYTTLGQSAEAGGPVGGSTTGSHIGSVQLFLVPAGEREVQTADIARRWRERVGEVPGVEKLSFNFNLGPPSGAPVSVQLSHRDPRVLETAAARLAEHLETYDGTFDIDDGYTPGKEQLDLELKPEARALGVTETDLARQVRSAFFGAEASRQQRGRDELRVYVRRPEDERASEYAIEELMVRTPEGGEILLRDAADIERGRSYTSISREEGRRILNVTADVDEKVTTGQEIMGALERNYLPRLLADYPGLAYSVAGEQQERVESLGALGLGFVFALLAMFGLLAVAFKSYIQPIIVLVAIPFGFVGAVGGHVLMGYELSFMSMMGFVALAGVVVNDSLVLIDAINARRREGGHDVEEAVILGGMRRFRPILLTSITTFLGLAPMIFETSVQARFLIPMALSLGFGILFVTYIALVFVPAFYMMIEDVRSAFARLAAWVRGPEEPEPAE